MCDSYGDVVAAISGDGDADAHYVHEYTLGSTEEEMGFYIGDWPADGQASPRDFSYLLEAPANDRKKRKRKPVNGNEPGRNDPCPCGSGKKYKKCCIDIGYVRDEDLPADLAEGPKNRTDEWIMAGAYYAGINAYGKALDCWEQAWPAVLDNLPDAVMDPDDEACTGLYNGFDFLSNWLQDVGSLIDDHVLGSIQAVQLGMEFYPAVLKRFPNMNEVIARNFEASLARLECACGKSEAAFARLQRMIEAYPQNAQGYAVLADLLSFDARTFGILPDIGQAQCLLTQALMIAKNAADWSLDLRLEDLRHWRD
ncbi:MAG: SEC-C domain-containing protein [Kiritimatiellales bacterium]|nr:SEC-C domain-containing protein [Kiritimatiellales bacterium]